jgi:hypothetical protein
LNVTPTTTLPETQSLDPLSFPPPKDKNASSYFVPKVTASDFGGEIIAEMLTNEDIKNM